MNVESADHARSRVFAYRGAKIEIETAIEIGRWDRMLRGPQKVRVQVVVGRGQGVRAVPVDHARAPPRPA